MVDGSSSFYDLFEQGGNSAPWRAWRGQITTRQNIASSQQGDFDQGAINTATRIVPMPIKSEPVPSASPIFRSPVVT